MKPAKHNKPLKLIWDIPTRLCHWSMVVLVVLQWSTAEWLDNSIEWHARFGYALIGVVMFRLVWGFVGTYYARFGQFLVGPGAAIDYLKRSAAGDAPVYTGHNPLGGWMSLLLLLLLLAQGVSGLFMTDDIFFNAPYYDSVSSDIQSLMAKVHDLAFLLIQIAVVLHICALVFYVMVKKQALIQAMFTGKKRTNTRHISHNYWLRALLIALVIAALVYAVVVTWAPEPEDVWY